MFNFIGRLTGMWLAIVIFINLAIMLAVFIVVSKIAGVFLGIVAMFFLAMAINESIRIVSRKYKWSIPVIPTIFGMKVWMGGFVGTLTIALLMGFLGDDLLSSLKELSLSVRGELSISSLSQADLGRVYKVKKGTPYYTTDESGKQIIQKTKTDIEVVDQGERKKIGTQHLVIVTLPNENDGWHLTGKVASFLATDLKSCEPEQKPQPPTTPENTQVAEEKKVIMEVSISGSEFPQSLDYLLPPGEYEVNFHPVAAAAGAKYRVIFPSQEIATREIKNNSISVKGGEEAFAIWTAIPSIATIRPL